MKGFGESDLKQHLSEADLRELQDGVTILEFPAGMALCREGDPAADLFIMRSGEALLSRHGRTLGLLSQGALTGEGALLAEGRHLADVTAQSEVTVYSVRAADLARSLQSRPAAATRFLLWVIREMALRLRDSNALLGTIAAVGQAASGRQPLALIGHDVLELLLRDIAGTGGAALFVWNRFADVYERLVAIHLDLTAADCETAVEAGRVFYLRGGVVAGVRMAQEEPVGALFVSRDGERPPFTRAEEILLETVGRHLTLAIHRAQDCREEAARDRLRCHPSWLA
jgi:CRP-like cAMP-binding protein